MSVAASITLAEAKDRIRIPDLWREFGYHGEPKKQCRCPFHEDRSPSFSVFDDGKRWKCHAGCGEGSVIDFLATAKGISDEDACHEILRRAEGDREPAREERAKRETAVLDLSTRIPWLPWNSQHEELAQRVADSRGLRIASVKLASAWFDTVAFGHVCDHDCWILSDASRKGAEARRIDGRPFPAIGTLGERKSHTLRGSNKSWPVGLLSTSFDARLLRKHSHNILLLEGGPDYLAGCQLLVGRDPYTFLPVTMLGASQNIAAEA
jgi:hypothetical protein